MFTTLFHEKNPWSFDFLEDGSKLYTNRDTGKTTTTPPFYLVFDTETTGFSSERDRIVSIAWGIFTRENRNVCLAYYIVRPSDFVIRDGSPATKVHGITQRRALREGVSFGKIVDLFDENIGHISKVVAHNISFDIRMLLAELDREASIYSLALKSSLSEMPQVCTLAKARQTIPELKSKKLADVYRHYYPGKEFKEHDALEDVKACAKCYRKMVKYSGETYDKPSLDIQLPNAIEASPENRPHWSNRGSFVYEFNYIGICSKLDNSRMAEAWHIQADGSKGEYAGLWDTVYNEMD